MRRHIVRELDNGAKALRSETVTRMAELKEMGQKTNEEIAAQSAELQKRQKLFEQALAEMRGKPAGAEKEG